ncbi:Bax inhibitor-1/YccA family protein [Gleimia hominis]|uniref:Bax inhibitor-1/YccA family protein n=1 Tax=Gleimia hominis TaxID=595468 RepID=A0ABU3IBU0_9ACTO|nr:Bax inhibitor-1/YccA family protein [Gleimia hominis]MDT3767846.1 Bax inhibitor-1/YccA family protein [Gleimia hominis]
MANPVMNSLEKTFTSRTPAGYPTMPGYESDASGQYGQTASGPRFERRAQAEPSAGYSEEDFEQVQSAYYAPSADAVDRGVMTYDDVIVKTGSMLAIVVAAAAVTWLVAAANLGAGMAMLAVGAIAGFVLAMVNIFKQKISPILICLYAAAEGMSLGGVSFIFETTYPGIVVQAVLASFVVTAVTLVLFKSGRVRNSAKLSRIALIGLLSLIGYRVLSLILTATNVISEPISNQTVFGIPIGVFVGVVAVVLGAICLIGDFDVAKRGVEAGAPKVYAWRVAFGIMVTLVWLYLEILRLLSYLRDN